MQSSTADLTALAFWTPANLAIVTDGRWLAPPRDSISPVAGLSIDSRTLSEHQTFLAIKGEHFDGHNFVAAAIDAGAAMVIVERDVTGELDSRTSDHLAVAILRVDDCLGALQRLAHAYRDVLRDADTKVIAVAGSNGKTTTRHLIHGIIDGRMISQVGSETFGPDVAETPGAERPDTWQLKQLHGSQAPRNFNNHIGVPLTLLEAKVRDDFVVVEIGTNHIGETQDLARIVRPDAVVITSVGQEHLEFFHNVNNVAKEQASLLRYLSPGGVMIVEHHAMQIIEQYAHPPTNHSRITFGAQKDNTVQLLRCEADAQGIGFSVRYAGEPAPLDDLFLPLLGRHNAINALAAIAVARWMGVDNIQLNLGILNVGPVPGRLEALPMGQNVVVINDAYNANPDSVRVALNVLVTMPGAQRTVVVLGDMFELGAQGPDAHRDIGRHLAELGDAIGLVILIGKLSMLIGEQLSGELPPECLQIIPQWDDQTSRQVAATLLPGDMVLLKASRGMQLEKLLPAIRARFGSAPVPT